VVAPSPAKQAALIAGLYFLMFALLIFLAGWLVPLGLEFIVSFDII